MKKLNLFTTGIITMFIATVGVNAASNDKITTGAELKSCLESNKEATCTVIKSLSDFDNDTTVTNNITLTLDKDVTVSGSAAIIVSDEASLTVDGGTLIKSKTNEAEVIKVNAGGTLTVKSTTLKTDLTTLSTPNHPHKAVVLVEGATTENGAATNVTLEAGSKLDGYVGLVVVPSGYASADGQDKATYNVTVNLNGDITAKQYAVQVNGNVDPSKNINVNVNAGTYKSSHSIALYAAGVSNWTISDGVTVSGVEAVLAKAGNVTINGGSFTTVKEPSDVGNLNQRAGNAKGAAVAALKDSGYNQGSDAKITLDIENGSFTAVDGDALYLNGDNVEPTVKDGAFVATGSGKKAVNVVTVAEKSEKFISGGSFRGEDDATSGVEATNLTKDLATGEDAEGNTIVGKKHIIKVTAIKGIEGVPYKKIIQLEYVEGELVDVLSLLEITDQPDSRTHEYAVQYVLSNGTYGLNRFTMPGADDITVELEIVEVPEGTEPSEIIPTTPGEPTNPEDPERDPEAGEKPGDEENPQTGDNVVGSIAMGIAGLVGIVGSALVFDKKTNYNN